MKIFYKIGIVIGVVIISFGVYSFTNNRGMPVELDEKVGYIPEDGFVPTKDVAAKVAEAVLKGIYGDESIDFRKPLKVELVKGVWVVQGVLPPDTLGGVPTIKISKKTGTILYIINYK